MFGGEAPDLPGTEPDPTVPDEATGQVETVAEGEDAATLTLTRGQYRTTFQVPVGVSPRGITGRTVRVEIGGEMKRIHFYKVDANPTGEQTKEGDDLTRVTAVFHVLDNPVPLAPVAWAAAGLVGVGGGSWLLFDSAEQFVTNTQWPILTGAAAILSIMVAAKTLFY